MGTGFLQFFWKKQEIDGLLMSIFVFQFNLGE